MVDHILGISDHLRGQDIAVWAALRKTGFEGRMVLFAYDVNPELERFCSERSLRLENLGPRPSHPKSAKKERWHHYIDYIRQECGPHDRVIATDVRDIFFQENPSPWLDLHMAEHDLITSSEDILYQNEAWNRSNALMVYESDFYEKRLSHLKVINCGVIVGRPLPFMELCQAMHDNVYREPRCNSDQIVFNAILSENSTWRILTTGHADGFVVHGAIMGSNAPRQIVLHREADVPKISLGKLRSPSGEPYVIVHQYDRDPEWGKLMSAE